MTTFKLVIVSVVSDKEWYSELNMECKISDVFDASRKPLLEKQISCACILTRHVKIGSLL